MATPDSMETTEALSLRSANANANAKKSHQVIYRTIWRWHFYAGIFCIPFILALSISGAIFLFKPQIEAAINQPYQNLSTSGVRTSGNQQISAALAAVPQSRFVSYRLPSTDHEAVVITVNHQGAAQHVYVHPYSLAVLKVSPVDEQLIEIVRTFHGELLAGNFGSVLVELAACWAIVLIVTGLYLWWPRSARGLAGILYPRLNHGGRIFWRDIHAVVGIWISTLALFLLITGLPWALVWGSAFKEVRGMINQPIQQLHQAHQEHQEHLGHQEHGEHQQHARQDWTLSRAEEQAQLAASTSEATLPDAVLHAAQSLAFAPPVELAPAPDMNQWTVKSLHPNRPLRQDAWLNADTGELKRINQFSDKATIDKAIGIGIAAHEGQLFGWFNQLLGVLTTLGLVIMSVSGFILWRKRKPMRVLGAPPPLPDARAGKFITGAVLLMALLLPLLAISLIVLLLIENLILRRISVTRQWLGLSA